MRWGAEKESRGGGKKGETGKKKLRKLVKVPLKKVDVFWIRE